MNGDIKGRHIAWYINWIDVLLFKLCVDAKWSKLPRTHEQIEQSVLQWYGLPLDSRFLWPSIEEYRLQRRQI